MKTRILFLKLNKYRQLKLFLSFILFLFFTIGVSGQITDNPNQSKKFPVREVEKQVDTEKNDDLIIEEEEKLLTLSVKKYTDSFDLTEKKSKGFSMIQNNDLLNPGVIYEEKWKKEQPVEGKAIFYGDQFLGRFDIKSVFVHVVYRDHGQVDGDRIRVFLNDDVIRPSVYLTSGYSGFKLNLKQGINKVEFEALNQGELGPNTAEFQVYDDNENLVSSNRWNLSTGSRASIIVVKE